MAYSFALMTLIFIKARREEVPSPRLTARPEKTHGVPDVQRVNFRHRVIETTRPANTCVSTLSLCNANFARS
jgi:hypothetical protein